MDFFELLERELIKGENVEALTEAPAEGEIPKEDLEDISRSTRDYFDLTIEKISRLTRMPTLPQQIKSSLNSLRIALQTHLISHINALDKAAGIVNSSKDHNTNTMEDKNNGYEYLD